MLPGLGSTPTRSAGALRPDVAAGQLVLVESDRCGRQFVLARHGLLTPLKTGAAQQRLPVSHQHRYETDTYRVANNLNQLFTPAGTPVGVNDIAARDLQTAAGTLKTPVGVNLIKHLS
jgi:hypothetical protein